MLESLRCLLQAPDGKLLLACITLLSGLLGIIISRFLFTKKEKFDVNQKKTENQIAFSKEISEKYAAYAKALEVYLKKKKKTFNAFMEIAVKGDLYFEALRNVANSLNTGTLSEKTFKEHFLHDIENTALKLLPLHYDTLQKIAKESKFDYGGKLAVKNYKDIYNCALKYVDKETKKQIVEIWR